jgi:hypothetical protein
MSYNQPPQQPQPAGPQTPPPPSDGWTTQRVLLAGAGALVCLLVGLLLGLTVGDITKSDDAGTTVTRNGTTTVTQTETSPPTTVTETDTVTETETESQPSS